MSNIKATLSAVCLIFWCIFGALTMLFAKALRLRLAESFPLVFHGFACRLFSLRREQLGSPATGQTVVYVSNHVSYLDVFVLGSMVKGAFVAKSEVASWPVFGKLARLQNTLFLERNPRRSAEQVQTLKNHLTHNGSVIMFPEGTSTNGTVVGTFRSSLFAAAEGCTVQPITVAYIGPDGEPMSQDERDRYAWYLPNPKEHPTTPNRPFASHFFSGMGLGRCTVRVLFHEPITMKPGNRKECALYCESSVRSGLSQLLGPEPQNVATAEFTSTT